MMGKKDHVIKLDCRSLAYEYVPFQLEGLKVLLLNTNVKHSLASSAYNTRRMECEQAVRLIQAHHPEVTSLRNANETMLDTYVLPQQPMAARRSRYVVQEIERLQQACVALNTGDWQQLGRLMYETHEGLSSEYEVSCRELDWLVDQVKKNKAVVGARMMGGGVGGCTINLVSEAAIDPLLNTLVPAYEAAMGLPLTYYIASIEQGTEIIED
jgi:galactokinase